MEIVVAVTGASGVAIAVRLLQVLASRREIVVHLIVSMGAREVIAHELGEDDVDLPATVEWEATNMAAPIASSSRAPDAMVVVPCSMKTLSAIGHGYAVDLIARVADVMLRMDHPLVLVPRETPLSLPAIESLRLTKLAGALILPPMVGYYAQPQTIDDVTDFFVGKILDLLGLEHELYVRWGSGHDA